TITAAALVAFARAEVEVAVLEVGLGGRCDATNIVEPVLSIITTIDLDHQEQLGDTLAAIAREKAGILRPGVTGLVGETRDEPLGAILETASSIGAPIVRASDGCHVASLDGRPSGLSLAIETPVRRYPRIECPLPGEHQINNVLLAVRAAEILERRL